MKIILIYHFILFNSMPRAMYGVFINIYVSSRVYLFISQQDRLFVSLNLDMISSKYVFKLYP